MSTAGFTGMGGRGNRKTALTLLLSFFLASTSFAAVHRLVLDPGSAPQVNDLRGVAELTVVPPFEDAKVTILVDGKTVANLSTPPYSVTLDFGTEGIEHKIVVAAKSRDGKKRREWSHVINRGNHPLSVSVHLQGGEGVPSVEAVATSPRNDPIVQVEFFDGSMVIASLSSPPYRALLPTGIPPVLYATARTKSGAEETAFLNSTDDVAVQSFQLRTVPLYVSVVDERGSARPNLTRSNFRVLDNGQEARILEFGPAFHEPISVALLLDASNSMTYQMESATGAARKFISETLREKDRLALFAIRDVPRREMEISPDWKAADEKLAHLQAGGNTAVYDAVCSAIRELSREKNRRAIVVFSDGEDTSSNASFDETMESARRAGIPIYVIAYGPTESFGRELDRLRLLAGETGGFVSMAATNDLHRKYEQIANDLRAQYAIRYQIGDNSKSNEWRPVRVVVNSPKLTARTIKGYFTP